MSIPAGVLYVVATPLGNLQDITPRALAVLREVREIYAEDTRRSAGLLRHFGIETRLRSLHEHNERRLAPTLVARLERGVSLALISDAGTPLISDPGYLLVAAVRARGLEAVPVPGPCALVCALSVAGLPTDRFVFEGFPPPRSAARREYLRTLAAEPRTMVFYEAPHRIVSSVAAMAEVFGRSRPAAVARELTKAFEAVFTGDLASIGAWLEASPDNRRGEFVVVVGGAQPLPEPESEASAEQERVLRVLLEDLSVKQAVTVAARLTGGDRNRLYRRAIELSGEA